MIKQIKLLTKLSLLNLISFNETRHSSDAKKKKRLYLTVGLLLFFGFFIAFMTVNVSIAICELGRSGIEGTENIENAIPLFLVTISSAVLLFFTLFRSGSTLFNPKSYEKQIVLPVSPVSIVISRFLTLYLTNLAECLFVMIPGMAVYAYYTTPSVLFYVYGIIGTLLIPMIPLTISCIIGSLIYALGSRMKHKNLIITMLSMVLVLGCVAFSFFTNTIEEADLTDEQILGFANTAYSAVSGIYYPAVLFTEAVTTGNLLSFFLYSFSSCAVFCAFLLAVNKKYAKICLALSARATGKAFRMTDTMTRKTPLAALYKRELKRYFASSIYVTNTLIGYVLMLAAAIALIVMGPSFFDNAIGIEGLTVRIAPVIVCFLASMSSTTSCAVSMEGKNWWIVQSLPVRTKDLLNSKILVNLTFAIPTYIITEIILVSILRTNAAGYAAMLLFPAAMMMFISVIGISMNLHFPNMTWEAEVTAVKQSASLFFTMLSGYGVTVGGAAIAFAVPADFVFYAMIAYSLAVLGLTLVFYRRNNKKKLIDIG